MFAQPQFKDHRPVAGRAPMRLVAARSRSAAAVGSAVVPALAGRVGIAAHAGTFAPVRPDAPAGDAEFGALAGTAVPAAPAGTAVPAGAAAPARPDRTYERDDAIVGHRLANGYMSIHAVRQPCGLCDGAAPLPPRAARPEPRALIGWSASKDSAIL